jgi:hypothetical protein
MIINQFLYGYNITLRVDPIALGGKLELNLAKTHPLSPWDLHTLPQMAYYKLIFISIYSVLLSIHWCLSFVNISHSLSHIKSCVYFAIYVLDF